MCNEKEMALSFTISRRCPTGRRGRRVAHLLGGLSVTEIAVEHGLVVIELGTVGVGREAAHDLLLTVRRLRTVRRRWTVAVRLSRGRRRLSHGMASDQQLQFCVRLQGSLHSLTAGRAYCRARIRDDAHGTVRIDS